LHLVVLAIGHVDVGHVVVSLAFAQDALPFRRRYLSFNRPIFTVIVVFLVLINIVEDPALPIGLENFGFALVRVPVWVDLDAAAGGGALLE
jgi:hypothetical protein